MTKVMRCTCNHTDQDSSYGKGMRVFNEMGVGTFSTRTDGTKVRTSKYRCTVCGVEK